MTRVVRRMASRSRQDEYGFARQTFKGDEGGFKPWLKHGWQDTPQL
jgi:hypothetical protein